MDARTHAPVMNDHVSATRLAALSLASLLSRLRRKRLCNVRCKITRARSLFDLFTQSALSVDWVCRCEIHRECAYEMTSATQQKN